MEAFEKMMKPMMKPPGSPAQNEPNPPTDDSEIDPDSSMTLPLAAVRSDALFSVGEQVFFRKSGVIVTVRESHDLGQRWTVEKQDGKRMIATPDGLSRLGPWGCLCKEFRHRMTGDGCCLCNSENDSSAGTGASGPRLPGQ